MLHKLLQIPRISLFTAYITTILFIACNTKNEPRHKNNKNITAQEVKLIYARRFEIKKQKTHKTITVKKPWKKAGFAYTYIVTKDTIVKNTDKNTTVIQSPVNRIACVSATHMAMISKLNATDKLAAIADADNTHNPVIIDKVNTGKIKETGSYDHMNFEKMVEINPDLIFESATGSSYDNYPKLRELGLNVAFVAAYMETHPLGKLEWIKYFGAFLGKSKLADSIFTSISKKYQVLKKLTKNIKHKPLVIAGYPKKDTWIAPGGNSYFARFLKDAGVRYVWADDTTSGNMHLSFETAFQKGLKADYWVNSRLSGISTYNTRAGDERFAAFKSVKNKNVYNNDRRTNEHNRNDYWETGTVEPHIILKDLIKIFHPEKVPAHQLKYYRKIIADSSSSN